MLRRYSVGGAMLVVLSLSGITAADNVDTANKSNNPLNPAPGLNFQNYYTPEITHNDVHTNDLLLRGALPLPRGDIISVPQLLRATVLLTTRPAPDGGYSTGLGDLYLFDVFLLKTEGVQLGIGPLVTAPTAEHDELGAGKWQAGLAAVAIDASPRGLIGALFQYQSSFAGDSDRQDVAAATFQPFLIHNLPKGWYLRSTGIWTFGLENNKHYIRLDWVEVKPGKSVAIYSMLSWNHNGPLIMKAMAYPALHYSLA